MVRFSFNRHDKANAARFMLVLWIVQTLGYRCFPSHRRRLRRLGCFTGSIGHVADHIVQTFIVGWGHSNQNTGFVSVLYVRRLKTNRDSETIFTEPQNLVVSDLSLQGSTINSLSLPEEALLLDLCGTISDTVYEISLCRYTLL